MFRCQQKMLFKAAIFNIFIFSKNVMAFWSTPLLWLNWNKTSGIQTWWYCKYHCSVCIHCPQVAKKSNMADFKINTFSSFFYLIIILYIFSPISDEVNCGGKKLYLAVWSYSFIKKKKLITNVLWLFVSKKKKIGPSSITLSITNTQTTPVYKTFHQKVQLFGVFQVSKLLS